jgi:hypothetical protein
MGMQDTLNDLRQVLDRVITDKDYPHSYLPIYEKEMTKINDVSVLEIGVNYGGSLLLWDCYFENATILGVDPFPQFNGLIPSGVEYPVYLIDSRDKNDCDSNFKDNIFDYIIDDGLHTIEAQMQTFDNYFSKLKNNGKYFIEDIQMFESVQLMKNHLKDYNYKFYDLRHINNRPDDMMFVITKD